MEDIELFRGYSSRDRSDIYDIHRNPRSDSHIKKRFSSDIADFLITQRNEAKVTQMLPAEADYKFHICNQAERNFIDVFYNNEEKKDMDLFFQKESIHDLYHKKGAFAHIENDLVGLLKLKKKPLLLVHQTFVDNKGRFRAIKHGMYSFEENIFYASVNAIYEILKHDGWGKYNLEDSPFIFDRFYDLYNLKTPSSGKIPDFDSMFEKESNGYQKNDEMVYVPADNITRSTMKFITTRSDDN